MLGEFLFVLFTGIVFNFALVLLVMLIWPLILSVSIGWLWSNYCCVGPIETHVQVGFMVGAMIVGVYLNFYYIRYFNIIVGNLFQLDEKEQPDEEEN